MKTKVITDSMSDISKDVAESYDIEVLPISVSLGGPFISAYDLDSKEVIDWIRKNKKIPDFRGVSTETYANTFEKHVNQGAEIVCITASGDRISNYDCACHASTLFPNANIQVINSKRVSSNIGLMAIKAAEIAKSDESANAITIQFERSFHKYKQFDLADSLEFLGYTGELPKLVTLTNAVLHTKFMLAAHEEGDMYSEIMGYNMSKAISNYCKSAFKNLHSVDPKRVFLSHTISDENYFAELYKYVNSLNYFEEIITSNAGSFTTSHIGPNSVNVAYQVK